MGQVDLGVMLYAKQIARTWKQIATFYLTDDNFENYKKWHLEKYGKEAEDWDFTK